MFFDDVSLPQTTMHRRSSGPPYASKNQSLGEMPSVLPDVPISAVFLVIYLIGAIGHMMLFIRNKKRGHFFVLNAMTFGFCNARITTFCLRMAWSTHVQNIRLGIASTVFVYAGTVMLFAINLVFTQRIIRAQHPTLGWSKPASIFFPLCYLWIILTIVLIIIATVQSFYTLDGNLHRIDRDINLYAQTAYAVIAFLPIPLVAVSTICSNLPSVKAARVCSGMRVDKFGQGSMTLKIVVVICTATILTLGAAFRAGINWLPPVAAGPGAPQPWYFSKPCFYVFNFVLELCVVFGWLLARIDQRFHVPNKSHGAYNYADYLAGRAGAKDLEKDGGAPMDSESEVVVAEEEERRGAEAPHVPMA